MFVSWGRDLVGRGLDLDFSFWEFGVDDKIIVFRFIGYGIDYFCVLDVVLFDFITWMRFSNFIFILLSRDDIGE